MTATLAPRVRELVAQAAAWRLLALLLEPPRAGWQEQLLALAAEAADADLAAAAREAVSEATEGLYHSAFGPGGPASPREVASRDTLEPGRLLAELEAHYSAFAYQPQSAEPADHIAIEAGFLGWLRLKEAYALASGEDESAAVTAEAAERFLEEHFRPLASSLAAALNDCGIRYLELVAAALRRYAGSAAPAPKSRSS